MIQYLLPVLRSVLNNMVSLLYCVNIHRLWATEKIRKNENGINSADNFITAKVLSSRTIQVKTRICLTGLHPWCFTSFCLAESSHCITDELSRVSHGSWRNNAGFDTSSNAPQTIIEVSALRKLVDILQ